MTTATKKRVDGKLKFLGWVGAVAVLFLFSSTTYGQEKIIYDTRGKAHRIPDINYVPPVKTGGIIPKFIQSRQPLQLVNPFANRSYGYGKGMVSWDGRSGKPKGFIAFSLKFW